MSFGGSNLAQMVGDNNGPGDERDLRGSLNNL